MSENLSNASASNEATLQFQKELDAKYTRQRALDMAVSLNSGRLVRPESIIAEAKLYENYLNGK